VLRLQDVRGLDTLPGGGDLDQDALLGDADILVELMKSLISCLKTLLVTPNIPG
jgi:hypothetical protein